MHITDRKDIITIASIGALLFIILSLPVVYELTSKISPQFTDAKGPTIIGITVHGVVYSLIMALILWVIIDAKSKSQKSA